MGDEVSLTNPIEKKTWTSNPAAEKGGHSFKGFGGKMVQGSGQEFTSQM